MDLRSDSSTQTAKAVQRLEQVEVMETVALATVEIQAEELKEALAKLNI